MHNLYWVFLDLPAMWGFCSCH